MNDPIKIYPGSIHVDFGKAKLAVATVAAQLGVTVDCTLMSMWRVWIDNCDQKTFLELAREEARNA